MKYQQKDFTQELKTKIQQLEYALKEHSVTLLRENKSVFDNRNIEFDAGFDIEGSDHFQPGYCSTFSISITDQINPTGELLNLHVITIWECQRSLFGLPVSKNIPGSKITGELVDESLKELKEELQEYIEEFLSEEY
ncbi:hypothetical protein [Planococcus dechangensis]|uniref:DUF302 domain-containing protein n=1 Tax=Planococcus dechangensis TaxID=1176255 RepID=A0ABV9MCW1_9BACL